MDRGMNKVILVTRKTRLEELVAKYNTLEQAKFYMEHMGVDFSDYLLEDRKYRQAVAQIKEAAEKRARVQTIDRSYIPNMILGERDVVITVGQDGMVANVMKYLNGQPLIGVNPDTKRWDGILLPFEPEQTGEILAKVLADKHAFKEVTMAEAKTTDGQQMLAVNDLFIGCRTHASARYLLRCGGEEENQSSSGIIISTGLGSTGWYTSVLEQARRIAEYFGYGTIRSGAFGWNEKQLTYVVREPFPSRATQTSLVFGEIGRGEAFCVVSKMPSGGVIFSDGMEEDAISFGSGMEVTVGIAEKTGNLVV